MNNEQLTDDVKQQPTNVLEADATIADNTKETTYDHVIKYIGVLGGVSGLKAGVKIVRDKLTALILGTTGAGVGAQLANISELINSATNMGISFGAVQHLSELFEEGTDEQRKHFVSVIRTWAIWTALLGALLCFGFSSLLDRFFFKEDSHTFTICLLSFFVFTLPLEAVECSIVKAMRKLKSLALIETSIVLGTFCLAIPLYYFMGVNGIVFSLIGSGVFALIVHFAVTLRMFPWDVNLFSRTTFREGLPLLKVGIPYVVASVAGTLSISAIYGALSDSAEIGLYSKGMAVLTISSGLVFSAMESDLFPRLSSANHDFGRMNKMINQHMQANVLLITPMLIMMALFISRLIYLLYSAEFIPVAPMVVCALFYVFFKAITQPISYIPLAKGHTLIFMAMEIIYDVAVAAFIYYGYHYGQEHIQLTFDGVHCGALMGAGIALTLSGLFDFLLIYLVYGFHYGFSFERRTLLLIIPELLCLVVVMPFCIMGGVTVWKYSTGLMALFCTCYLAYRLLAKKSNFVGKISRRFRHSSNCDCCNGHSNL